MLKELKDALISQLLGAREYTPGSKSFKTAYNTYNPTIALFRVTSHQVHGRSRRARQCMYFRLPAAHREEPSPPPKNSEPYAPVPRSQPK